jgi:hypothetical protein
MDDRPFLPVTLVTTRSRSADDLTGPDYRELYDEVRGLDPATGEYRVTLRAFVALIQAAQAAERTGLSSTHCLSIAYWSKYHRGEIQVLNRQARDELRALVGRPELPITVAEACARVDPDATVYQVGDAPHPGRVILVATSEPVALSLNGALSVLAGAPATTKPVTPVTRPRNRKVISMRPSVWTRLNEARLTSKLDWNEFMERLAALL